MFTTSMDVFQTIVLCMYLLRDAEGYIPSGYIGGYTDNKTRVLQGKRHFSKKNSGKYCKNVCIGFRYAGTESEDECYCGNDIRVEISGDKCNEVFPGNHDEICGGHWHISIYDTWPCATLEPCKNHASCIDISADKYLCHCSGKWTGRNCDDDGDKNSSIAIYVIVPFALIVPIIVLAIVLWRRRHKSQIPDDLPMHQSSLPNIYANITKINNVEFVNATHMDMAIAVENNKVETNVKDFDAGEEMKSCEHYYSDVNMSFENTDGYTHLYDHISTLKKSAVNKTYAHLSETSPDNKLVLNTNYSHIEKRFAEGVTVCSQDDNVTYNKLDMNHSLKDGLRTVVCHSERDYDHATKRPVLAHSIEPDNYSHLNDVQRVPNLNDT